MTKTITAEIAVIGITAQQSPKALVRTVEGIGSAEIGP